MLKRICTTDKVLVTKGFAAACSDVLRGLALLGLVLLGGSASLVAQRFNFTTYGTSQGLPQSQVYCIHQDRAGYLWVGTLSGLARFNGREWRVFDQSDGLVRNHITAIAEDEQGVLWFGSSGGGVVRFDGAGFSSYGDHPVVGQGVITALLAQGSGRVWVGGRQGLALISGEEVVSFASDNLLPSRHVTALFPVGDDRILVATSAGTVLVDRLSRTGSPFASDLGEVAPVRVILADPVDSDTYFVGGDHGLMVYRRHPDNHSLTPLLEEPVPITHGAVDQRGTLWFATRGHGLLQLTRTDWGKGLPGRWITRANGLSHDVLHALGADREGNLWIGTDFGLNKLSPSPFLVYREQHGLPDDFVRALYEDRDGVVWVGTRDGVAAVKQGRLTRPLPEDKLHDRAVYSIGQQNDGTMVLGTRGWLVTFDAASGRLNQQSVSDNLQAVRAIHRDPDGRLWLGGDGIGFLKDGVPEVWTRFPVLQESLVMDIASDDRGRLWMATRNRGLFIYDARADHLKNHVSPFTTALWSLSPDERGGMWVGSNGQGAFYHNGTGFKAYDQSNGLSDAYVWFVFSDAAGAVWFGHNRGVDRLYRDTWRHYTTADGLAENEMSVSAVLEDRDGNLWMGSGLGLTSYHPGQEPAHLAEPRLHLEEVAYFHEGGWFPLAEGDRPEPGNSHLRFRFIGISFRNTGLLRYRFRLVGFDADWTPETQITTARYSGLPPGDYQFEVQVRRGEGDWSDSAVFGLSIPPFFYQTLWFKTGTVLLALLLMGFIHRARMVRVKNHNKLLEEIVAQRTREVAAKNQQLQQLALLDPLTKLHNRRFFDELMPLEEQKLQRQVFADKSGDSLHRFGFMLIDIDHFCRFNQLHGRDLGDEVLKQFAEFLHQIVRSSDVVVRWQNDAFFIFFKDLHQGLLANLAERLLEMVREHPFTDRGVSCTCSIGYSYYPVMAGEELLGWQEMVTLTEQALRMAKQGGRNRAQGIGLNPELPPDHIRQWIREDLHTALDAGALTLLME
ncbi:ligand-binding sensor domain-containing protein [Acanthopleuribacter pedis]|uniref:diguanylate cyclase n=1 Tax=Acanthopleuribacter pedis TaxID=442870 RepID=A0A8J7Q030_9BACT|nr:ligand-binding sensor domain-containing diguanylate cyclase [Acanthopleuribacter pedis]MBO1316899.1 diguanylate cyclase [Acanthopleuribacter pedis]